MIRVAVLLDQCHLDVAVVVDHAVLIPVAQGVDHLAVLVSILAINLAHVQAQGIPAVHLVQALRIVPDILHAHHDDHPKVAANLAGIKGAGTANHLPGAKVDEDIMMEVHEEDVVTQRADQNMDIVDDVVPVMETKIADVAVMVAIQDLT